MNCSFLDKIFRECLKAKYSSDTPLSFYFDEGASMFMTSLNYCGLQVRYVTLSPEAQLL